jgi:hypothetical protein
MGLTGMRCRYGQWTTFVRVRQLRGGKKLLFHYDCDNEAIVHIDLTPFWPELSKFVYSNQSNSQEAFQVVAFTTFYCQCADLFSFRVDLLPCQAPLLPGYLECPYSLDWTTGMDYWNGTLE